MESVPATRVATTEAAMRELIAAAGVRPPDEVHHDAEHAELVFLWNDERRAVVIELSD